MSKVQLLFEGHLSERVAPQLFRIVEPFPMDGSAWANANAFSGKAVFMLDDKVIAYTTGNVGFDYLYDNQEALGISWDEVHHSGEPICLRGTFIEYPVIDD